MEKMEKIDIEVIQKISNDIIEAVRFVLEDETQRVVVIGLSIIVVSLFMIYKNTRPRINATKKLGPQISIDTIREAGMTIKSDLAEAVGEMKEFVLPQRSQRFRKRDRVWFYGRRMIRRVEDNIKYVEDMGTKSRTKSVKMLENLTKKVFLGDSSDTSSLADVTESRPAEDWFDEEDSLKPWVPQELKYLLNSFHMFGQFDPALFAELYPEIESLPVSAGQYLFRIGDPDKFIFVVQSGKLNVTCSDSVGTDLIKKVGAGESLTSLLSFIDVLTGHPQPFKTVQAQARVDSVVLRLSMDSFLNVFKKNPELLIRVVQMVMARVQRVIFVGLHSYLGLSNELIRPLDHEPVSPMPAMSLDLELAMADNTLSHTNNTMTTVHLMEGVRGFQRELNLMDDAYLRTVVQIREYDADDIVLKEAAHSDIALGYVIQGKVTMYVEDKAKLDKLYSAEKGECFGQLAMLTGEANFYSCKASKPTVLALLSKSSFVSIVSESPEMVLSLAHSTIARLSQLVRKIDFALDWLTVEAGHAVKSGDMKTLLILSGRLRGFTVGGDGERKLRGEYGRGDMVGLVDVITGVKQKKQYLSVRDSEVCVIPGELLEFLKSRSNVVMAKIIKVLGNRLVNGDNNTVTNNNTVKYNSIAVFGNRPNVPVLQFCHELELSLGGQGTVCRLNSKIVQKKLGKSALTGGHDYRINSWLGQQEDRHQCVIYQCDTSATEWTKKCLRHADIVLVLCLASESTDVTSTEKELETMCRRIRKELVLLWSHDTVTPSGTKDWLKRRSWLSGHNHVKMPARMTKYTTEGRINKQYSLLAGSAVPDLHNDFSRIGRSLQGQSIGLVLGGGGARGAAHMGMLKSILECGIPIDKVGGVSIGAFVGGQWSLYRDFDVIFKKTADWFHFMTRPFNFITDLTYPITSLFSGANFNESIKHCFTDHTNIEDLWLPYYCVSTDISTSTERVHKSGAVWRYVRASMSYSWLLPPICDPVDGHLLMDGCYVNNVPGDVMLRSNCSHIIVVDVTARDDTDLTNYGDNLSGWWLLWKRWNPFTSPIKIPTQGDLQERLAFCSHYKNLNSLKDNPNYEYIQPPVGHFLSSKFGMFKEIYNVGYHHGSTFFFGLKKSSRSGKHHDNAATSWLPTSDKARVMCRQTEREKRNSDNYTFTDLAEMVRIGVRMNNSKKNSVSGESVGSRSGFVLHDPDSDDTGIML